MPLFLQGPRGEPGADGPAGFPGEEVSFLYYDCSHVHVCRSVVR